jgi:hypothetical protein
MIFCHVAVTTVDGYVTRREPHRRAHLDRLVALRGAGTVIGGGPAPDGTRADLFYRVRDMDEVRRVVEEDPYVTGGVWAECHPTAFAQFLEPWQLLPVVTDGSRRATIVEGQVTDVDMAAFSLIEARGAGRMAFGGFFPGARSIVVMSTADADEAVGWLAESGFWEDGSLAARPWLHVL